MRGMVLGSSGVLITLHGSLHCQGQISVKVGPLRSIAGSGMDFDDYDSYAPIRPDPPKSTPPPSRHRFRALAIVLGVLSLAFVVGTDERYDDEGE